MINEVDTERAHSDRPFIVAIKCCSIEPKEGIERIKTKCGHYFCEQCMNSWLQSAGRSAQPKECPICLANKGPSNLWKEQLCLAIFMLLCFIGLILGVTYGLESSKVVAPIYEMSGWNRHQGWCTDDDRYSNGTTHLGQTKGLSECLDLCTTRKSTACEFDSGKACWSLMGRVTGGSGFSGFSNSYCFAKDTCNSSLVQSFQEKTFTIPILEQGNETKTLLSSGIVY